MCGGSSIYLLDLTAYGQDIRKLEGFRSSLPMDPLEKYMRVSTRRYAVCFITVPHTLNWCRIPTDVSETVSCSETLINNFIPSEMLESSPLCKFRSQQTTGLSITEPPNSHFDHLIPCVDPHFYSSSESGSDNALDPETQFRETSVDVKFKVWGICLRGATYWLIYRLVALHYHALSLSHTIMPPCRRLNTFSDPSLSAIERLLVCECLGCR